MNEPAKPQLGDRTCALCEYFDGGGLAHVERARNGEIVDIAIDCDGTATRYPEIFVALGRAIRASGGKVYILTGIPLSVFVGERKEKYPHLSDTSWYDEVITSDQYNDEERSLAGHVIAGRMDNHDLVGIYKRRICRERGIDLLFDDDVEHVRAKGGVPVFGVAKQ